MVRLVHPFQPGENLSMPKKAAAQADSRKLAAYRSKRDFARTPEPAGTAEGAPAAPGGARRFVVQRHRARRLHYDLRFEIDGVLASWAVPKGPTLDPAVKRAAVHVEDHPIEYLDFEGVIPAGEYGGGDVIVWDRGTWEPHATADPAAAVAAGELHADVHGEKLRGRLVLVRRGDAGDQWLLLHKNDQFAAPGWDPEDHPRSVLSGRTNEEVKADPERLWDSSLPAAHAAVTLRGPVRAGPEPAALDELAAIRQQGTWRVFGRRLKLTNLDKVLFPARSGEQPVTKREFIGYTARIAPVILPYLAGRALNMHRFPDGADAPGFWHKQLPAHAPDWVPRWDNPEAGRSETRTYLVVAEPAALIWAANFGALEWHAWTSPVSGPHKPSYALIDIDPGPATSWEDIVLLARLHRTALEHVGVRGQPKLTGRRGLQIWIPVKPGPGFGQTRHWVEQLSKTIGGVVPELVSWKWDVSARGGEARLDYTQNAINKTLVTPYSPRAAAGAPVSVPIDWDELDDPKLRSDSFTIRTVPDRLASRGDPFRWMLTGAQPLPPLR
jgi:bifunctional non-homologous end joining protein LigD